MKKNLQTSEFTPTQESLKYLQYMVKGLLSKNADTTEKDKITSLQPVVLHHIK